MKGAGCRVKGVGCRVQGVGCRVWGAARQARLNAGPPVVSHRQLQEGGEGWVE